MRTAAIILDDWAPEGEYTFSVRGRGVGSDVDDYQSYTFYVDNTKPELKSAELFEDENGALKLAINVSDNKYLQFLWVIDSARSSSIWKPPRNSRT